MDLTRAAAEGVGAGASPAPTPGALPCAQALLSCRGVSKSFGGVHALRSATFDIAEGSITALIGPNGAGKTTLFNCMTGFLDPDEGEVWFDGRRIDGKPPYRIARLGMVRTFQSIRMFSGLTVFESLLVSQYAVRDEGRRLPYLPRPRTLRSRQRFTEEILELMRLQDVRNRRCTDLPLLAQRKVEVARAIACRPRMLLLDEPSAGATPAESRELLEEIQTVRTRGVTVCVIEHNVPFVMGVSDAIVVMNFGEIVAGGTPQEIAANEIVQEVYLGAVEDETEEAPA